MVRRPLLVATLLLLGAAEAGAQPATVCAPPHDGKQVWATMQESDYRTDARGVVETVGLRLHGHGVDAWLVESSQCGDVRQAVAVDPDRPRLVDSDTVVVLRQRCFRDWVFINAHYVDGTTQGVCSWRGPPRPPWPEEQTIVEERPALGRVGRLGLAAGLAAILAALVLHRRRRAAMV